ncbi:RDD family protein [Mycolicibacterium aubagnense]|uniref:RDD family protein n=1 Tax=Mycolicibacterium aubagnense TaxID=319707 RepID=A0ABM7I7F8_9MYCO|nr:RDD family protein [Mycolicibacterium aubagnense]TLH63129.1 RDD family protein [Mycolicibacterium aubagnense]WGI30539.1 RDD family protein [Mycolicibacterium aubagnense]BBX82546.1 RDD family protein [Mycolicibacterium aubagnense]
MTYGENYPTSGAYGAPVPVHPGDLLPRFFARFIDGLIVVVLAFFGAFSIGSMSDVMVTGLFSGLGTFLYFVLFEVLAGATPGKMLLGLSVRGPHGMPKPDIKQSAIRNSFTLLPIIPWVGGLLAFIAYIYIAVTINSSPCKQGRHDELAGGTQVVKK